MTDVQAALATLRDALPEIPEIVDAGTLWIMDARLADTVVQALADKDVILRARAEIIENMDAQAREEIARLTAELDETRRASASSQGYYEYANERAEAAEGYYEEANERAEAAEAEVARLTAELEEALRPRCDAAHDEVVARLRDTLVDTRGLIATFLFMLNDENDPEWNGREVLKAWIARSYALERETT